jgi:hypothetical protein
MIGSAVKILFFLQRSTISFLVMSKAHGGRGNNAPVGRVLYPRRELEYAFGERFIAANEA